MRLWLVGPSILTALLSLTLFAPSAHGLVSLKRAPQSSYQTSPRQKSSGRQRHYMFNAFGGTKTATSKPSSSSSGSSAPAVYDLVRTNNLPSHTQIAMEER
jgi:hypothetical protein